MLGIRFFFLVIVATVYIIGVHCQGGAFPCGPNETFIECGSGCGEPTCQTRRPPGPNCPAICLTGCYCNPGWIRRERGGPCVQRC